MTDQIYPGSLWHLACPFKDGTFRPYVRPDGRRLLYMAIGVTRNIVYLINSDGVIMRRSTAWFDIKAALPVDWLYDPQRPDSGSIMFTPIEGT